MTYYPIKSWEIGFKPTTRIISENEIPWVQSPKIWIKDDSLLGCVKVLEDGKRESSPGLQCALPRRPLASPIKSGLH